MFSHSRRVPPRSLAPLVGRGVIIDVQRLAVQIFGALHLDQHREPLLLRIPILLRLNQPFPSLRFHGSVRTNWITLSV